MSIDKVNINYINSEHKLVTELYELKNRDNVEELLFDLLKAQDVGPLYRWLFGLCFVQKKRLWLSPNSKIQDVVDFIKTEAIEPTLELRMRFRPASFKNLWNLDRKAFDLIFAQMRHDFIHTRFTTQSKDLILLDSKVLGLIVTDLIRHAVENKISIEEVFKQVDPKQFIPHSATRWQRLMLFPLREKLELEAALKVGYKNCNKDLKKIKLGFIELFLDEVFQDYGTEVYKVISLENIGSPRAKLLRVRFSSSNGESTCLVETKGIQTVASPVSSDDWKVIVDIESLNYGTYHKDYVEINSHSGKPSRLQFKTGIHAKSFLSILNGYYRLMKRWNFNFSNEVSSPHLQFLKKMKSHGPISYEDMLNKLGNSRGYGDYLIRQSREVTDKYLIDFITKSKHRAVIEVVWCSSDKLFKTISLISSNNSNLKMTSDNKGYPELKDLIHNLRIVSEHKDDGVQKVIEQLIYLIPPYENDNCHSLLLSTFQHTTSRGHFINRFGLFNSINELPKFIPKEAFRRAHLPPFTSNNQMLVEIGQLINGEFVVLKSYLGESSSKLISTTGKLKRNLIIPSYNPEFCEKIQLFKNLEPPQHRLVDWIYMKGPRIAETIGIDLTTNSLLQEFFPLGQVDRYLMLNNRVPEIARKSIALQLSQAILFLHERQVSHGKIRLHNLYLKSISPLEVKLTDPLGTFDEVCDAAFLPPEYQIIDMIHEYLPGVDVWAFGTTVWQIYTCGRRPEPGRYASTLFQPSLCSDEMWNIIETCWTLDPDERATPLSLQRELNELIAWEREADKYEAVSTTAAAPSSSSEGSDTMYPVLSFLFTSAVDDENPKNHSSRNGKDEVRNDKQLMDSDSRQTTLIDLVDRNVSRTTPGGGDLYATFFPVRKPKTWSDTLFKDPTAESEQEDTDEDDDYSSSEYDSKQGNLDSSVNAYQTSYDSETVRKSLPPAWLIDSKRVKLGPELGRGSCGVVLKGLLSQWGGLSEQVVAVKCIATKGSKDFWDFHREFAILRNLKHDNIIKTIGFVHGTQYMMLVLEYMANGSLLGRLKNTRRDRFSRLPLMRYSLDIARGMSYLESLDIVHRDLALRNVLISDDNHAKISDFGLAHFLGDDQYYKIKTERALPLAWYAPESLKSWTFDHSTDIWSYGITIWEIYSGGAGPQYSCSNHHEALLDTLKHERLPPPDGCPDFMYELMLTCWASEPKDRGSFASICRKLEEYKANQRKTRPKGFILAEFQNNHSSSVVSDNQVEKE